MGATIDHLRMIIDYIRSRINIEKGESKGLLSDVLRLGADIIISIAGIIVIGFITIVLAQVAVEITFREPTENWQIAANWITLLIWGITIKWITKFNIQLNWEKWDKATGGKKNETNNAK